MARYGYYGGSDDGFPRYVSAAEKRARNRKATAELRRQNSDLHPVEITGRSIASSWWGKSWCANLERYADYSNRIARGRSYVRCGAVLDLGISPGRVRALVQGSRSDPYEVSITFEPLQEPVRDKLRQSSLSQLDSLGDLLAGRFPQSLKETFFAKGEGLFPSPQEISFSCSCPDWASMCKHVAAVLYGVGNRLDTSPEALFTLRNVSMDRLIAQTVDAAVGGLVAKADQAAGDDVLVDSDLGDVFGIEWDHEDAPSAERPAPAGSAEVGEVPVTREARKAAGKKSVAKPRRSPGKRAKPKGTSRRKGTRRRPSAGKPEPGRMLIQFQEAAAGLGATFTTMEVRERLPEWTPRQVTNTLQRALRDGLIEGVERGVYHVP